MAVSGPRELFFYELGVTYAMERSGDIMLSDLAQHVHNRDLAALMHEEEDNRHQQLAKLNSCIETLGLSPLDQPAPIVEGLRSRFQVFTALQPSPDALDLFVLGTTNRLLHLGMVSYQELVGLAELLGESECGQCLQANLTHKEGCAAAFQRLGHEMGQQFLATA